MVAAFSRHETVYTVLGDAARKRGARSLGLQLVASLTIGTAVLVLAPHWWSLAFLSGWSAAYSAWGLLVRLRGLPTENATPIDALLVTIAALGTALAIAGMIGVGLAIYSGNARGVKDACGKGSTNERCQAWAKPALTDGAIRLPP
jgi:hypothetical protein